MLASDRKEPGNAGLFVRWATLVVLRPLLVLLAVAMGACTYATKQSVVGACPNTVDSGILNFCEVTPGVLWRGGKLDRRGAAWLMQHGVRTIIFGANAKYLRALGPERRVRIEIQRQQWVARLKPDARISCAHGRCVVTDR